MPFLRERIAVAACRLQSRLHLSRCSMRFSPPHGPTRSSRKPSHGCAICRTRKSRSIASPSSSRRSTGWSTRMLAHRQSLAEQQLDDQGEQNKLTRKELAAKKAEFRKAASHRRRRAWRRSGQGARPAGPLAADRTNVARRAARSEPGASRRTVLADSRRSASETEATMPMTTTPS